MIRKKVREIGLIEKQSSMWFQAKTCESNIEDNVVFNGPRAAINFNDGFGGGTNTTRNLIFNQCRESGDHGPINAWDRTSFISDVYDGTPSYTAKTNSVAKNFIIANYGARTCVHECLLACLLAASRSHLSCARYLPLSLSLTHILARSLAQAHRKDSTPTTAPRGTTSMTTSSSWPMGGRWTTEAMTRRSPTT